VRLAIASDPAGRFLPSVLLVLQVLAASGTVRRHGLHRFAAARTDAVEAVRRQLQRFAILEVLPAAGRLIFSGASRERSSLGWEG
jgi:hypothetical protein